MLLDWYPNTKLDLDEEVRSRKFNKFGGMKYVYDPQTMGQLRKFFESEVARRLPRARVLYWT